MQTAGTPVTRAMPCAMKPPPCRAPGQHMMDQSVDFDSVVDRQDRAAGNAGQRANALLLGEAHNNLVLR